MVFSTLGELVRHFRYCAFILVKVCIRTAGFGELVLKMVVLHNRISVVLVLRVHA